MYGTALESERTLVEFSESSGSDKGAGGERAEVDLQFKSGFLFRVNKASSSLLDASSPSALFTGPSPFQLAHAIHDRDPVSFRRVADISASSLLRNFFSSTRPSTRTPFVPSLQNQPPVGLFVPFRGECTICRIVHLSPPAMNPVWSSSSSL
ncbi:hypothetical protein BDY24DRAFT_13331 [Mrakia frigida]|uniref:uncharacterized protein n=1 Tax=Mrakia frigida TaxID=29902 RepID=UPI003FCC1849